MTADVDHRFVLPRHIYAEPTLADVMPSVLASLGVAGERNRLELSTCAHTVVFLVDGMGWNLLRRHRKHAPFLNGLPGRSIRAGFPTTTAVSLASLGTGLPSGEHAVTGYQSYLEELDATFNWLRWRISGDPSDQRSRLVPEEVQPRPTAFERAVRDGITTTRVVPRHFDGSGLTRAVLRGGTFDGIVAYGDLVAKTAAASTAADRTLVYCYIGEIDTLGHFYGAGSPAWSAQLAVVDRLVEHLAVSLAPGVRLLITADHGMVNVEKERRVDFDHSPVLSDGVVKLAGEPRCRHVYTDRARTGEVLDRWRTELGEHMWVGTREDVITAGLVGATYTPEAFRRIGDIVAIAHGDVSVIRSDAELVLSGLPGQHGALTDEELLVPLL